MPRRARIHLDGMPLHIAQPCSLVGRVIDPRGMTHQHQISLDFTAVADVADLFHPHLDKDAVDDIRLALNQNQPLDSKRFLAHIEQITGIRSEAKPQAVQVGSQWLERAGTVSATGGDLYNAVAADADHKLEVTGHSLGGHLAMAFSTLFPGFTTEATVFNAPGFAATTTNQAFFAALNGTVPTGANITNVIADEASPQAANHSIWRIAA